MSRSVEDSPDLLCVCLLMSFPPLVQKRIYIVETHNCLREAWISVLRDTVRFDSDIRAVGSSDALDSLFSVATPDLLVLGCESDGFNRKKILDLILKCSALGVYVLLCSIDDEWSLLISKHALCAFVPKTVDPSGFLSAVESSLAG